MLLTLRYSTGLVTLNLSMVEMMMAGVVRKKSRRKRLTLMTKQRIHQETPPRDRCSLKTDTQAVKVTEVLLQDMISVGSFYCSQYFFNTSANL